MKHTFRLIASASLAFLLASCGGGSSGNAPTTTAAKTPQNMTVQSNCVSATLCTATFTWQQPDYTSGQGFVTTIVITLPNSQPVTVTETGITNSGTYNSTSPALQPSSNYTATFSSRNNAGISAPGTVHFTTPSAPPPPPPETAVASNGVYLYNQGYDLTASGATSATSAWASAFSKAQVGNIRYLYVDFPNANSIPSGDCSTASGFNTYYANTVQTLADTIPPAGAAGVGFTYLGKADHNQTTINGNAVTQAYSAWPSNQSVRVIPLVDSIPLTSTTPSSDLDCLAHAIAHTIDADPSAAGVTFDIEGVTTGSTGNASNWYYFLQQMALYLQSEAGTSNSTSKTPKFLSDFGSGEFRKISNATGTENLYSLFSKASPYCSAGNCFLIYSYYDLAISGPDDNRDTLPDYTADLSRTNSLDADSTVNTLIKNADQFQFAIPGGASATSLTYGQGLVNFSSQTGQTNAVNFMENGATPNPPSIPSVQPTSTPCTSGSCVLAELNTTNNAPVTQANYICAALSTFNNIAQGNTGNFCTPADPLPTASSSPILAPYEPTAKNYFMGVALYLLDGNPETSCTPNGSGFCIIPQPSSITAADPLGVLTIFSGWASNYVPGF